MTADATSPGKRKAEGLEDDTPSKKEKTGPISDSPRKVRNVAEFDQRKTFKEGQKNITPPVADPTRGFYESLLKENPTSKIAVKWVIEHGVLSKDEHNKLLKQYNKLKDDGHFNAAQQFKKAQEIKKMMKEKKNKEPKEGKEKKEKKEKKDKADKENEGKTEAKTENKEEVKTEEVKKEEVKEEVKKEA